MFRTKYLQSFYDIKGDLWLICIQQDTDEPFDSIGGLDLEASPLEIEWPESSQEEAVAGSSATLRLNSMNDREFIDMYSVEPCQFRMLVYNGSHLYWSGTLDPEFSEEPYSREKNYEVQLTFSDFGPLDRMPYSLSGAQTIDAILNDALSKACLKYSTVDSSMISTCVGQNRVTLGSIAVQSENFFDEDGVAMSLREVLDGVLQPLGLKMIQKAGRIYIYDLNGLYNSSVPSRQIVWVGTDQTISSDKVYNDIKIALSTYAKKTSTPEFKYTGDYSASMINLADDNKGYYSYFADYGHGHGWDRNNVDFTIFTSRLAVGLADCGGSYFHIEPVLGSENSEGVAVWFYTGGHGSLASGFPHRKGLAVSPSAGTMLMKTQKIYLPPLPADTKDTYRIRLTLEMLFDARYNPFADASADNESGNYRAFGTMNTVFVPAKVLLYDAGGNVVSHYKNKNIATSIPTTITLGQTMGAWENGNGSYDDCLLQFYDPSKDPADGDLLTGWIANRQTCGHRELAYTYESFKRIDDGQYIPYPIQGGYLEVTVCGGMTAHGATWYPNTEETDILNGVARWMLFKAPVIEILKGGIAMENISEEDVEYTGLLNPAAKDTLEINTICGTMADPNPAARALYQDASTGAVICELTRAGRTTQAEQLLIGTLYSQFASRRFKLSGTIDLDASGLACMTEAAQPSDRLFYLTSEIQRIREAESEMTAAELRPDEYDSTTN